KTNSVNRPLNMAHNRLDRTAIGLPALALCGGAGLAASFMDVGSTRQRWMVLVPAWAERVGWLIMLSILLRSRSHEANTMPSRPGPGGSLIRIGSKKRPLTRIS